MQTADDKQTAGTAVGSALRLRFASLPTRIIVSVFSAALVTGMAVTLISTGTTESFLRQKIDERFPQLLLATAHTLDQWYVQRERDLGTFASSHIVKMSVEAKRSAVEARQEAERYLAYVREGFPQYRSLFVLDADARPLVSVGAPFELPVERLAQVSEPVTRPVMGSGADRFQVISAPIVRDGRTLGSLHAVVAIASVEALLVSDDPDVMSGIYVVGPGATVLARSPASPERVLFERPLPRRGDPFVVEDYTTPDGSHVVGTALRFQRFDWTLVVEQEYGVAFAPVVSVIRKVLAINLGIVVVFGLIALLIARSIVRPIRALSDGARRIAQGDTDVEIPRVPGQDEIGVLSRALSEMVDRLRHNQVELQKKQAQIERANLELTRANEDLHRNNEMLEQLSFTDGLTRLHNHRYFQDRLRVEAKRCDRTEEPLALLLLDIDDFKSLNDRYGHATGDDVLRRVGSIVNNAVRETDLPARYGGEEFAVLAPRTGADGALALAEKLRVSVSQARFQGEDIDPEEIVSVTVSIGVALYESDAKKVFNQADRALYQAKAQGKDCVVLFDEERTP